MSTIAIKVTDKADANGAATARGELEGADYTIVYEGSANGVLVDTTRAGGNENVYGEAWITIGKKD